MFFFIILATAISGITTPDMLTMAVEANDLVLPVGTLRWFTQCWWIWQTTFQL